LTVGVRRKRSCRRTQRVDSDRASPRCERHPEAAVEHASPARREDEGTDVPRLTPKKSDAAASRQNGAAESCACIAGHERRLRPLQDVESGRVFATARSMHHLRERPKAHLPLGG
jgi:hypothetical protein